MRNSYRSKRKQLKKRQMIILSVLFGIILFLIMICVIISANNGSEQKNEETTSAPVEVETTAALPEKYIIDENVKVIKQDDLKAGCETYACTMLLNMLGFDLDEHTIADNYLNCQLVYMGEEDGGENYGPDLYSAFAGTAYGGWGVYAPSMAKSMNNYLKDQNSKLKAYNMENVPLEDLVDEYVSKGVPVMVWATTDMDEPYVFTTWIVNYVDENARTKLGDTFSWYMHEHCLVLIGYNNDNYYFADSTAGKISVFKKDLVKKRYEQMGQQSIVVK